MIDSINYKTLSQTEKYLFTFASLFKDIVVYRDGGYILVPLLYASNSRSYDIANMRDLTNILGTQYDLRGICPAISYELINPFPATERQMKKVNSDINGMWNPVPYTLDVRLNVRAKNKSEVLQIFESIVPAFQDSLTPTVRIDPELLLPINIKIIDTDMIISSEQDRATRGFYESTLFFHIDVNYTRIKKTMDGQELNFDIVTYKNNDQEAYDG